MRFVLFILLLLVIVNTFLGDGRILRHIGIYEGAWDSLRVVLYVAGTLLLALMFVDIAVENFSRFPHDLPDEDEEEDEEADDEEDENDDEDEREE